MSGDTAAAGATHGTGSATNAGTAGPLATGYGPAGPIHPAQDPHLGASVRQTFSCEPKPGGSQQGQREPEERRELPDASAQLHDLLSELRFSEVHNIQTDRERWRHAKDRRAVERGTPRSMARVTSPVRWTRCRSRWS